MAKSKFDVGDEVIVKSGRKQVVVCKWRTEHCDGWSYIVKDNLGCEYGMYISEKDLRPTTCSCPCRTCCHHKCCHCC